MSNANPAHSYCRNTYSITETELRDCCKKLHCAQGGTLKCHSRRPTKAGKDACKYAQMNINIQNICSLASGMYVCASNHLCMALRLPGQRGSILREILVLNRFLVETLLDLTSVSEISSESVMYDNVYYKMT